MTDDELSKIIWDYMLMHQPLQKADAIFVLGSDDLRVAEYAAKLYFDGWAPFIIFSGDTGLKGRAREKWGMAEAEKFASIARELGVPERAMLLEPKATNTGENIQFTKKLLAEQNLHPKRLLLLQKPYMERRTYAAFAKQWPGMEFGVSSPPISYEDYPDAEHPAERVINMLVGDLERIKEYPTMGFQIDQDIPEDVWNAHQELKRRGFTRHALQS